MSLKDDVPTILAYVKNNKKYLAHNAELLTMFNGQLKPFVDKILQKTLSDNYYQKIKDRSIPINVLKRVADKTSKTYLDNPMRETEKKYKEDIDFYAQHFYLNQQMAKADEYSFLFKGYALEPYLHLGVPKLRVLPYDRFIPYSADLDDPTYVTHFIKLMGKIGIKNGARTMQKELFYIYTTDEFIAITDDGHQYSPAMEENEGVNPYGVIPFYYGNRGNDELLPTQDTDISEITKLIPVFLTDLSGAIMFQCFSVIYGIDVVAENLTMSPNAFWGLKSDPVSGKEPKIGTIKPETDIDKVINFIMTTFTFWLETRGIKVGNVGSIDAQGAASGIAKIIDEMDTTELVKKSMACFKKDEHAFFQMLKPLNNYWVQNNMLSGVEYRPNLWLKDFTTTTIFDEPEPMTDRKTQVETVQLEVNAGFLDKRSAMMELYPDLSADQIDARMALIANQNKIEVTEEEPPVNG